MSDKYKPFVVNSGIEYELFKINAPIISAAIINNNIPKIGYIPMILSTGNTVAIKYEYYCYPNKYWNIS